MMDFSKRIGSSAAMVSLLLSLTLLPGCGYGEVSPETYELATALYSICNRRDADRLPQFEKLVADSQAAGTISSREAGWLSDIVAQARNEDWEEATLEARELLEDQAQGL